MDIASERLVDEIVKAEWAGVSTRMEAIAVVHHCAMRSLSLFDFQRDFRVMDGELVDRDSTPVVPGVDMDDHEYQFADWREDVSASAFERLERLRKHIAEVRLSGNMVLLDSLISHERRLARIVEPIPTLGMVAYDLDSEEGAAEFPEVTADASVDSAEVVPDAVSDVAGDGAADVSDDESDDVEEPDSAEQYEHDPLADTAEIPVVSPASQAEKDEIAAVLANPKSAASHAAPARVDKLGRELVSDATLAEIYAAGKRIGISEVAAQELVVAKFKIRQITDLTQSVALKVLKNMRDRAAS